MKTAFVFNLRRCKTCCLILFGMALSSLITATVHHDYMNAAKAKLSEEEEHNQLLKQRDLGNQAKQQQLIAENQRLKKDLKELPALRAEVTQLRRDLQNQIEIPKRQEQLLIALQKNPGSWIPGLRLIPEDAWAAAIGSPFSTEEEVRKAVAKLRKEAMKILALKTRTALQAFQAHNQGESPNDINELLPFFELSLQQEIRRFSTLANHPSGGSKTIIKAHSSLPSEFDWTLTLEVDPFSYHYKVQTGHLRL